MGSSCARSRHLLTPTEGPAWHVGTVLLRFCGFRTRTTGSGVRAATSPPELSQKPDVPCENLCYVAMKFNQDRAGASSGRNQQCLGQVVPKGPQRPPSRAMSLASTGSPGGDAPPGGMSTGGHGGQHPFPQKAGQRIRTRSACCLSGRVLGVRAGLPSWGCLPARGISSNPGLGESP